MYYRYFGLDLPPFSITPDPRFVYFSERHQEALAHLLYGIGRGGGGGFVQLTGEVGTGKTTLSRLLLEELPGDVHPALILNPALGPRELIAAVCDELGIAYPRRATRKQLVDLLNRYLLEVHARGGTVVLIIDEAQNLGPQALEQVRLLTNLETHTDKLLQIILIGQPELRELLWRPNLRQLAQRVTARYHLGPLAPEETAQYVGHRLQVAGAARNPFTRAGLRELHRESGGVPRLVNVIADRALLAAFTERRERVGAGLVRRSAREVLASDRAAPRWRVAALAALLVLVAGAALWLERERLVPSPRAGAALDVALPAAAAWRGVADRWQANWPAGAVGCEAAGDAGLACVRAEGAWSELVALAVPVLLRLDGADAWIAASNVEEDGLTRLEGGARLAREAVERRWSGQYALLLRLPGDVPASISPGDGGPAVAWLRARARRLDAALDDEAPVYDQELERWVRRFQDRVGLPATGIADAATLVLIVARSAESDAGS